jgi:hypothetical protein
LNNVSLREQIHKYVTRLLGMLSNTFQSSSNNICSLSFHLHLLFRLCTPTFFSATQYSNSVRHFLTAPMFLVLFRADSFGGSDWQYFSRKFLIIGIFILKVAGVRHKCLEQIGRKRGKLWKVLRTCSRKNACSLHMQEQETNATVYFSNVCSVLKPHKRVGPSSEIIRGLSTDRAHLLYKCLSLYIFIFHWLTTVWKHCANMNKRRCEQYKWTLLPFWRDDH